MNQITGDKQFVLQLLKDTARNLAVRHPEALKPKGAKKAMSAISEEHRWSVTRSSNAFSERMKLRNS